MSDQDISSLAPVKMQFPDGSSKIFKGTQEQVNAQAKEYWGKKSGGGAGVGHLPGSASPKTKAAAVKAAPGSSGEKATDPVSERKQIDDFRMKFFNSLGAPSIPQQAAEALAKNPGDKSWAARVRQMHPISQKAIAERAKEIQGESRFTDVRTGSVGPGGFPGIFDPKTKEQAPPKVTHDLLQTLALGPEGARQLQGATGFDAELMKFGTGLPDPDSIAMMLAGGGVANLGKWPARIVTGGFAGMMGKSAYDKLQSNDPGGAAADLLLGGIALGAHGLAEGNNAKAPKEPPPPRPTTARVHEPSGLGPGPEPPRPAPSAAPPSPGPEPPPEAEAPPQEPPRARRHESPHGGEQTEAEQRAREAGRQRRQQQRTNSQEYRDRQARQRQQNEENARQYEERQQQQARDRAYESARQSSERARQAEQEAGRRADEGQRRNRQNQQRPSPDAPGAPYVPSDPGTPHPEVDKFNAQAEKVYPGISDAASIAEARARIVELNAKNKLNRPEKADFIRANNKVEAHNNALSDFADRYKQATGQDFAFKKASSSIGDRSGFTDRFEVMDRLRQSLRSGTATFDKLFPDTGFTPHHIVDEPLSTDVSHETKPGRFSALEEENAQKSKSEVGALQHEAVDGSVPKGWEFTGGTGEGVPEGVSQSPKLSAPQRQRITGQLAQPGPQAVHGSASGNLYLNPEAASILMKTIGIQRNAAGWTLHGKDAGTLSDLLEGKRVASNITIPTSNMEDRTRLAAAIRDASSKSPGGSVVFYPRGIGSSMKPSTITRHEGVHVGQNAVKESMSSLTGGINRSLLTDEQEKHIEGLPGVDRASAAIIRMGYKPEYVHKELPAYIATLDHERLGLSDQEAEDIMFQYAKHLHANYGADALATMFGKTRGAARTAAKMSGGRPLVPFSTTASAPPSTNKMTPDAAMQPLPPKAGSGPVGRVARHGNNTLNAMNKFDATTVIAPVRAEMMVRDLYDGLTEGEKDLLGEWLIGNRLNWDSTHAATPELQAAAQAHPRYLDNAELANIASNPRIKNAIDKWEVIHKPVLDKISGAAGVSSQAIAAQSPHYFPLVPPEFVQSNTGTGSGQGQRFASWESRGRPQSSSRRHQAKYSSVDYSTDVGGVLRTVLRRDEPKAALNDLWRTLDSEGLIAIAPRGAAGRRWVPPEGYVGDEIAGKFSSMPADLVAKYGGRGKVFLPQDVVQSMDEITEPHKFSGSRELEVASRISRTLISTTLGLNVPAVPWHIYRQTALLRASTALADAKRNPATILANSIPIVGTVAKGVAMASRNADDPVYRAIYQRLVEINATSPRSMEGITGNLGRLPLMERWNAILHDSMFGVPHGKGFNGWAGRVAVEAYLARARFEQTDSPERDREYIAHFGAYMRRLSPMLGAIAEANPFVRTHAPRVTTSIKLATGDTGLQTPKRPGESDTTWRLRQAADRIAAFAMIVALPVVGLVALNRTLSGKWPWENGKGHELDLNLGHGHYFPVGRVLSELEPATELLGLNSRMHRERNQKAPSMPSGAPRMGGSKLLAPVSSNAFTDAAGDALLGAGNTAISMMDSPAMNAGAAVLNKRMYLVYDNQKKTPDLLSVSPTSATLAQRAINTAATITGASSIVPTQGYRSDGPFDIGKSVLDYLTQSAIKKDYPHGKGMKQSKVGGRRR